MNWAWWVTKNTGASAPPPEPTPDPEPPPPEPPPPSGGTLAETLSQIRQRIGWMIARAENAVGEFTGQVVINPDTTSALSHAYKARDELTLWIDAGVNDLDDIAP